MNKILLAGTALAIASSATAQWANATPAISPTGRIGCEMVYDINAGVTRLYGGHPLAPFGGAPGIDETWEWNGSTWTQVFPIGTPGGLAQFAMAHDSDRNTTVLYGGTPDTFFVGASDQTWEYAGGTWTQIVPATTSLGGLTRAAMCYHPGIQRTVLFGGFNDTTFSSTGGSDDVWLWDGSDWTAAPITGPRPLVKNDAAMAYDSTTGKIILSGGYEPAFGGFAAETDETWELDLTNNTWKNVTSPAFTPARSGAGMAYDAPRELMVMAGGNSQAAFTQLNDTWEFSHRSVAYGNGCAGSNGTPTLDAADAPRFGQTYTLNVTGLNLVINLGVMALSNNEIAPGADLGLLVGMTGCTAYVPGDILDTVAGAGGNATWTTSIPNSPGLLGATIFAQYYSLDPGINAFGFVNSNAHRGTVGN